MASSVYDDPSLTAARTAAQTATQNAAGESVAGMTLADELRTALNDKFSTDNPIYAERENTLKDYLNMTTQAPLNITPKSAGGLSDVVYNPIQQANLIQQYRSPSVAHLATLNDLLNLATGGIENIIGSTSRAHTAYATGEANKASLANTAYTNLLTELAKKDEEARGWATINKPTGGGGEDFMSLLALIAPELMKDQITKKKEQQYLNDVDEYIKKFGMDAAIKEGLVGPNQYR